MSHQKEIHYVDLIFVSSMSNLEIAIKLLQFIFRCIVNCSRVQTALGWQILIPDKRLVNFQHFTIEKTDLSREGTTKNGFFAQKRFRKILSTMVRSNGTDKFYNSYSKLLWVSKIDTLNIDISNIRFVSVFLSPKSY